MVVWELQLERRGRPERVSVSWEHRSQTITALCWDTSALRVFAGDSTGRVTFLRAGSSKLGKVGVVSVARLMSFTAVSFGCFFGGYVFALVFCLQGSAFVIFPIQTVTTVDSRVVQLGYHDGRLLVSSLSRCYLCDTER